MNGLNRLKEWCGRERESIEKMIDFWYHDDDSDMVHYEFARLDELVRIESIISELKESEPSD